jgi:O-antigen ligase
MWTQSLWAIDGRLHLEGCVLFTKYLVLAFILERLLRTEKALDLFAWAHVGGCFLWGWLAYTMGGGGRVEMDLGPGVGDSNTLGFHLSTGLAFAGIMLVGLSYRRRLLLIAMIPFMLNGVILTASRGATLAMVAAGFGVLMFAPRVRRGVVYAAALLGVVLFLRLAQSDLFWQRMETLWLVQTGQPIEPSAETRIEVAKANWRMFLDNPLGVGHQGNVVLSPQYMREELLTRGRRSAHNTMLAVLIDQGVPGFLLFLSVLGWAAVKLMRLKRLDRRGLPVALGVYRGAVAGGIAAYAVAGLFGNFLTAEIGLWLLALVSVLDRLSSAALAHAPQAEPSPAQRLREAEVSPVDRWGALHPGRQLRLRRAT